MIKDFSTTSFVIGIMIGVLLSGVWFLGDDYRLDVSRSSSPFATSTGSSLQESDIISVVDQPSGDSVTVDSITIPPLGVWVAVLEVTGRDFGNVLGATRIVGPRVNVEVSLLRSTGADRSYAVQLYRDDNNGVFDPATNSIYVDFDTGARVVNYFTTTE